MVRKKKGHTSVSPVSHPPQCLQWGFQLTICKPCKKAVVFYPNLQSNWTLIHIYVELNTILDSFLTGSVKKQERIFLWNLKNFPTHLWKILKSLFNFNFLLSFCYQILSWLYMLLPYLIYSLPAAFLKPPLHLRDEMLNSLLRWRYQLQLTKKFLLSIDCIISMPAF